MYIMAQLNQFKPLHNLLHSADKCSDVSREKRFPCEQRGKEQMICEGKGCCHDGGASWNEPTCFFHSGVSGAHFIVII